MVSAEGLREPADDGGRRVGPDIPISSDDRFRLQDTLAELYPNDTAVTRILRRIEFPSGLRPSVAGSTSQDAWDAIFYELGNGAAEAPYRRLLEYALQTFRTNAALVELATRYGLRPQEGGPA
ncbi:effector-associated domain EAD1-containing protein, partial [Kitasatospora putterlickiae]|uniref:effector-associated domain EAD1-containing protein n=1 Tax=Kitasatospora putterlickiae TaxID=221725 RepID=UPI0031D8E01A